MSLEKRILSLRRCPPWLLKGVASPTNGLTAVEQWGFRKSDVFVQESLLLPHSFALKFPLLRVIPRGDSSKMHDVFLNQTWVYLPKQSKTILLTTSGQRVLEDDALTHLLGLCAACSQVVQAGWRAVRTDHDPGNRVPEQACWAGEAAGVVVSQGQCLEETRLYLAKQAWHQVWRIRWEWRKTSQGTWE